MRFDNLLIGEVITLAYSVGSPKTNLPTNSATFNTKNGFRTYCPFCLTRASVQKRKVKDEHKFECNSCLKPFNKPFVIKVEPIHSPSSHSSSMDPDWIIINGMQAGTIISKVEKTGQGAKHWALWKYHPEDQVSIEKMMRLVIEILDKQKLPVKSLKECTDCIEIILTLLDCTRRQVNATSDFLAKKIGKDESYFRGNKKWALFKENIEKIFNGWDEAVRHAAHDGLMEVEKR